MPHQVRFDFPDKKWHRGQRYIRASQFSARCCSPHGILCAWCCNRHVGFPQRFAQGNACEWATKLPEERSSVVVDCRYRGSCSPLRHLQTPFVVHAGATISRFPSLLYPLLHAAAQFTVIGSVSVKPRFCVMCPSLSILVVEVIQA